MRWLYGGVLVTALVVGCGSPAEPSLAVPTSGACAGIPLVDRNNPPAGLPLTPDPVLEQKLPTQIDGLPVTDLSSGRFVETLCLVGGEASLTAALSSAPAGVDLNSVTVASASATVDGRKQTLTAYRIPGNSGDALIPVLKFSGDLMPVTVGGKAVKKWTNAADGATSYLYSLGDTLFIVEAVTDSQAGKILAALP